MAPGVVTEALFVPNVFAWIASTMGWEADMIWYLESKSVLFVGLGRKVVGGGGVFNSAPINFVR